MNDGSGLVSYRQPRSLAVLIVAPEFRGQEHSKMTV